MKRRRIHRVEHLPQLRDVNFDVGRAGGAPLAGAGSGNVAVRDPLLEPEPSFVPRHRSPKHAQQEHQDASWFVVVRRTDPGRTP